MPIGVDVGQTGAHADAVGIVHGDGPYPTRVRIVQVGILGETGGHGSPVKCLLEGQPVLSLEPPDRNWTLGAVKVVPDVDIGFQLPQIRQHFDEGPLVITLFRPRVVVFWHAAQYHLAVDRAGSADYLASWYRHGLGLLWAALGLERPIVRGIGSGGSGAIAEF